MSIKDTKIQDCKKKEIKELRDLVLSLTEDLNVVEAYACGSRVNGTFTEESDYDIAVYVSGIDLEPNHTIRGTYQDNRLNIKCFSHEYLPYKLWMGIYDLPLYSLIREEYHPGDADDTVEFLNFKKLPTLDRVKYNHKPKNLR